jgi:hypothetical protein
VVYKIAQTCVGGAAPAIATWVADNIFLTAPGFFVSGISASYVQWT